MGLFKSIGKVAKKVAPLALAAGAAYFGGPALAAGGLGSIFGGASAFNPFSMIASVVGGSILTKLLAPKEQKPQQPDTPAAPTPPPTPQAAQTPDQAARRAPAFGAGGAASAAGSTLLTGPEGVAPSLLNLGKNSVLGA